MCFLLLLLRGNINNLCSSPLFHQKITRMIVHPSVRLCAFYSFTLGRHFNSIKILLGYYVATFKPNRIWHQHHGHDHRHNQDHHDHHENHLAGESSSTIATLRDIGGSRRGRGRSPRTGWGMRSISPLSFSSSSSPSSSYFFYKSWAYFNLISYQQLLILSLFKNGVRYGVIFTSIIIMVLIMLIFYLVLSCWSSKF